MLCYILFILLLEIFAKLLFYLFIYFSVIKITLIFFTFRDVPECSVTFRVPDFLDGPPRPRPEYLKVPIIITTTSSSTSVNCYLYTGWASHHLLTPQTVLVTFVSCMLN